MHPIPTILNTIYYWIQEIGLIPKSGWGSINTSLQDYTLRIRERSQLLSIGCKGVSEIFKTGWWGYKIQKQSKNILGVSVEYKSAIYDVMLLEQKCVRYTKKSQSNGKDHRVGVDISQLFEIQTLILELYGKQTLVLLVFHKKWVSWQKSGWRGSEF